MRNRPASQQLANEIPSVYKPPQFTRKNQNKQQRAEGLPKGRDARKKGSG